MHIWQTKSTPYGIIHCMSVGAFVLSLLIDNSVGRVFLMLTRLWINSAIRQIVATTKVEYSRSPRVITGLAYPNILISLRIISKTNVNLDIEQVMAETNFEGLYGGTILWVGSIDNTIEKKGEKEISIEFASPLQVFLLNSSTCSLHNGTAKLRCFLGEVIVPFSTKPKKIDNFNRGLETVKKLLNLTD